MLSPKARAWGWFALKGAISLGLLALLLSSLSLEAAFAALRRLSWPGLTLALALVIVAHAVNAWRLTVFLPGLGFPAALRFTFIGTFYSTVLPSQLAGDAIKAVRMARVNAEPGRAVSAVVRDKLMGLAALISLSLAAVPVSELPGRAGISVVLALALIATGVVWYGLDHIPTTGFWARIAKYMPHASAAGLTRRQLAVNFAGGVLFQALVVAIFAVVGVELGIAIAPAAWVAVVGFVSVVLLLPVTVAGIGLRDASLIGFLEALGQTSEEALALSFVILLLSLFSAAIGLVCDLASRDSRN